MEINKRLFTIAIVIFSILAIFSNNSYAIETQISYADKSLNYDGYIIQFNEEPLLRFKNRLMDKLKKIFSSEEDSDICASADVQDYKNKLLLTHKIAKEDVLEFLGKLDSPEIFFREFIDVFNGILIKNIPDELIQSIEKLPYVKAVIPNYRISITLDESVPLINADDVWKLNDSYGRNITGQDVTIAILDTGVDYTHPDLKDNYISQGSYDFVNNDADPMDDNGHGTHCAGIACGQGNESNYAYVGVAPGAKFYAIKILDQAGHGDFQTYLAGMQKAVDPNGDGDSSDHVDVVSLSFGTDSPGSPDDQLCEVLGDLVDAGVVVVAAAGNLGPAAGTITSPGCAVNSICVGSTTKQDVVSQSSSRGPVEWNGNYMVKPDIVAPGVDITSTRNGGGYTSKSGTSMATPHVAGAAALVLQANPEYTPEEVKQVLKDNAVDLGYDSNTQGAGRLDVLNVFLEDRLKIDVPEELYEREWFRVKITNKTGSPIKAWILITFPLHLPRLKYGSSVVFKAPIIFLRNKEVLPGKIRVFKPRSQYELVTQSIVLKSKNII